VPIEVFVADEQSDRPVDPARWGALAEAVLRAEGVRGEAELSVLFVDELAIAALNKRFLDRDGPTDVLSFPIEDEPVGSGRNPDSGGPGPGWLPPDEGDVPTLLGDVVICPEVAHRHAPDHAGTYEDELALLIVHGVLHLLGMDHEEEVEAEEMERREQDLLDRFYRPAPAPGGDATAAAAGGGAGEAGGEGEGEGGEESGAPRGADLGAGAPDLAPGAGAEGAARAGGLDPPPPAAAEP
jgi:probable rRNA maturation factor